MNEWLKEFYNSDDLRETLRRTYGALFLSYAATLVENPSAAFVTSLVDAFIDRYLGSSRAQLQEIVEKSEAPLADIAARFDEWQEKRPAKVSANETVRAANAVRLDAMRGQGVERKVWASSGGSCPYCSSLDGRTVEVDRDFFTPDETYHPEGAETPLTFTSSIGHPPIHQGCDCSVVPG